MARGPEVKVNLPDTTAAPKGTLGQWALLSCRGLLNASACCCSNNRISAAGARSLGLGLRVNQTLRILIVSDNLTVGWGEALHTSPSPATTPIPSQE